MTQQGFIHATRLGSVCTHPIAVLHADHIALACDGLEPGVLEGLAAYPAFAKPLNLAVAQKLGLDGLVLQPETLKALETNRTVQALCALIIAPFSEVEAFLKEASAVRLQEAILKCVLKAERQKVQMLFGDSAYNTAVREAPMLYPALASDIDPDQLLAELDKEWGVCAAGASALREFARRTDAGLLQLLDLRLPKSIAQAPVELTDLEAKTFARLLRAKGVK